MKPWASCFIVVYSNLKSWLRFLANVRSLLGSYWKMSKQVITTQHLRTKNEWKTDVETAVSNVRKLYNAVTHCIIMTELKRTLTSITSLDPRKPCNGDIEPEADLSQISMLHSACKHTLWAKLWRFNESQNWTLVKLGKNLFEFLFLYNAFVSFHMTNLVMLLYLCLRGGLGRN